MLEGRSSDRSHARAMAYNEPARVDALVEVLVEASWRYLAMQARAGAQALMLFESWAEGLPQDLFERLVVQPHARLLSRLRGAGIDTPVIGFPRGGGALVADYAKAVNVDGVGLDTQASARLGREIQASGRAVQGALDPLLLRAGGAALDRRVDQLLEQWGEGPFIFNLGHGILPDVPVSHVEQLMARVTGHA
jgi:uroporphyrinogen decarboxylase